MSLINKILDPIFETNKEQQSAFDSRFNTFYDKESFRWTTRTFSFLPESETLKIQALYAKLNPFFECTALIHIQNHNLRLLKKDIFSQKQDVRHTPIDIDISQAPYYQWIRLSSEKKKNELLANEFGIKMGLKFQILVFRIRPDYALMVATAQANPWLKIKLDALTNQIVLGFCDNE